ncbi:hypothetical protein [Bacillus sp. LR_5]|uniref:hypothetical protein n=1 Tax=Bacillus sp. LR_5 TaxID=3055784 RepID=UPI00090AA64F|nr:hypothetical protein BAX60_10045 [Bacillus subtilis]
MTNIIPQQAKMIIETRLDSEEVNRDLEERVRRIIAHSAAMHELEYNIEIMASYIRLNVMRKWSKLYLKRLQRLTRGREDASQAT